MGETPTLLDAGQMIFESVGKVYTLLDSVVIMNVGTLPISYLDIMIGFAIISLFMKVFYKHNENEKPKLKGGSK